MILKYWRLEVLDLTDFRKESMCLTPIYWDSILEDIPDLEEIRTKFLSGPKNDKEIRNMGIVISHDATLFRRVLEERGIS